MRGGQIEANRRCPSRPKGIIAAWICKQESSASRRRTPSFLRHSPIDALEQIAQFCRRDRDRPVGGRRPEKTPSLQPFREQAQALPIVPQALDEIAAATAKDKSMGRMRIALQRLLHDQRKPIEPLAHVGAPRRKPHPNGRRDRDHRRDSALTTRTSAAAPTRIRSPAASTISMRPTSTRADASTGAAGALSSETLTGKSSNSSAPPRAALLTFRRRQVNNRLALTP